MNTEQPPSSAIALPYQVPRRATWTSRSRAAVGRKRGGKIEVAMGSGAVEHGSRNGEHVICYLPAGLTEEQMQTLATAERAGAPVSELAESMTLLANLGLSLTQAAQVMGLSDKAEASRMRAIAGMSARVLKEVSRLGLTRNHARWLLDLDEATVLDGLRELTAEAAEKQGKKGARRRRREDVFGSGISVADVRAWRKRLAPPPSPAPDPAAVAGAKDYSAWISERLNTPATIEVLAESQERRMRLGFVTVDALAGVMEQLGRVNGEAPAPPEGAGMRWLTIDGVTDDELVYLVGRAD